MKHAHQEGVLREIHAILPQRLLGICLTWWFLPDKVMLSEHLQSSVFIPTPVSVLAITHKIRHVCFIVLLLK